MTLTEIQILKSRSGVYSDNAKNRRLHRVGQHYGSSAQQGVESAPSKRGADDLSEHMKHSDEEVLAAIKKVREKIKSGELKLPEGEIQKLNKREEELLNKKESKKTEKPVKESEEISTRVKFDDMPNSGKVKFKKYLSKKNQSRIDDSFKNLSGLDDETLQTLHDSLVEKFNSSFEDMKKSERAESLYKVLKVKHELSKRSLDKEKQEEELAAKAAEKRKAKRRERRLKKKESEKEAGSKNSNVDKERVKEIQEAIYESQDNPVHGQVDNTSETDPENFDGNSWFEGNVSKMTKDELADRSIKHIQNFLKANNLPVPEFVLGKYSGAKNKFQETGHYSRAEGRVYLNAEKTRNPVLKPGGMQWSYPGYKVDKTPLGVLAHEVGHHIDHVMKFEDFPVKGEKVTGYEPTVHESIAESLRLFILNPDLLKNIAPNRYQYFIDKGLKPTVTKKWGEVLHDAPKEYFEQVEKQSKKI